MNFFVDNINLVLFLPLLMCFVIGFNGLISNKIEKSTLFSISIVSSFICILFSAAGISYSFFNNLSLSVNFPWIVMDSFNFYLGTYLDKISGSFLFGITILSFVLQLLSYIKLKDTFNYPKLLLLLNLFLFGMSGVFLSSNLFQTYLFCEITGVASYLLINFDFSNRQESKAGIKSFVYNRIGDLFLLFCVLTVLYYSVVYNQLNDINSLSYSNMSAISTAVNAMLSEPLFIVFCSMLIFVIVMKFMQAFIYITFESPDNGWLSKFILYQNSLIGLIGLYLFLRLDTFLFDLSQNWPWTLLLLFLFIVGLFILNKIFKPLCKIFLWIEQYIIETFINFIELFVRAVSYICGRFQTGNFQSYLIYSIFGLIFIFAFVLIFYEMILKI